jgi:2-dehydropantoate 2-reductase
MRWVVYGLGAIGGVVAAELHEAGFPVTAVARGRQLEAVRRAGLRVETPERTRVVDLEVAADASEIRLRSDDVVLLTVKSHDTPAALRDVALHAPGARPAVVCLQNGVANEGAALRRFDRVYGACVWCPAAYVEPGVVVGYSSPTRGIVDLGVYPCGDDELAQMLAQTFRNARFMSQVLADVRRWKYGKLLTNLTNAIDAICGPNVREGPIAAMARREAERCFQVAAINYVTRDEERARCAGIVTTQPVSGHNRRGASSWQSLARGTGSIETDYLNGEIVLLGRLFGVPTPVNAVLQRLANELAGRRAAPGSITEAEVLSLL